MRSEEGTTGVVTTNENKILSVYQIGLHPTPPQRKQLDRQVWGHATAYNWALWIVRDSRLCLGPTNRPDIVALNKIVVCQKEAKIHPELLSFFGDRSDRVRFFDGTVGSCTKLCAVKSMVQNFQVSRPERVQSLDATTSRGTFGVQKAYVRRLDADNNKGDLLLIHNVLSGSAKRKGNANRTMKLSVRNDGGEGYETFILYIFT